jgi:hypothetical protein
MDRGSRFISGSFLFKVLNHSEDPTSPLETASFFFPVAQRDIERVVVDMCTKKLVFLKLL